MRGRKPVPTALKIIRGNPGKRPLPKNEPAPPLGIVMPSWLSEPAKKHWDEIRALLEPMGVLTSVDSLAFGMLCESMVLWVDAKEKVAEFGAVVQSSSFPAISPYFSVRNKTLAEIDGLLAKFGMTPSDRTRVTVAKPREEADPFADLFAKRRTR